MPLTLLANLRVGLACSGSTRPLGGNLNAKSSMQMQPVSFEVYPLLCSATDLEAYPPPFTVPTCCIQAVDTKQGVYSHKKTTCAAVMTAAVEAAAAGESMPWQGCCRNTSQQSQTGQNLLPACSRKHAKPSVVSSPILHNHTSYTIIRQVRCSHGLP